jgi:hypothetical protein
MKLVQGNSQGGTWISGWGLTQELGWRWEVVVENEVELEVAVVLALLRRGEARWPGSNRMLARRVGRGRQRRTLALGLIVGVSAVAWFGRPNKGSPWMARPGLSLQSGCKSWCWWLLGFDLGVVTAALEAMDAR